ncbi:MAG: hypothetical protein AAF580_00275 [Pseudomonadota bacterium]
MEAPSPSPGLPLNIAAQGGRLDRRASPFAEAARQGDVARDLATDAANREGAGKTGGGTPPDGGSTNEAPATKGADPAPPAASDAAAQEEAQADGGPARGGGAPSTGGAPAVGSSGATAAPNAFPIISAPILPLVLLPDLSSIRTPLVPAPPAEAQQKRTQILARTGRTPSDHHAAVQTGVNRVADVARTAQRAVVSEIENLAARTGHDIAALAERVPGIVAAGIAKVRAETTRVRTAVADTARAQMNRVANHTDTAVGTVETQHDTTQSDMRTQLMVNAPQELQLARQRMQTALSAAAVAAGQQISGIKDGRRPQPVADGAVLTEAQQTAANKAKAARDATLAKDYPLTTFQDAAAALGAKLSTDRPNNRLAQFGNMKCEAALPGQVRAQREAYARANGATVSALAGPANLNRLFDQMMGLTLPISSAFAEDEEGYTEHLDRNADGETVELTDAKKTVLRRMDQRLSTLLEEELNEDHKGSAPQRAIASLKQAGEQLAKALRDQAQAVETSLRANLATLAGSYPDLVERLRPMVETGQFLDAAALLRKLADAEQTVGTLRAGHIETAAAQAAIALSGAHDSFHRQTRGLHQTVARSVKGIAFAEHRAAFVFVQAANDYTGEIQGGTARTVSALQAHSAELARRLLGPQGQSRTTLGAFNTAAIQYLNGVMDAEWGGYLHRVNNLEDTLGGVQTESGTIGRPGTPFYTIREGVRQDTLERANNIINALPPRMSTGTIIVGYINPLTTLATAVAQYQSDPDESAVVEALSLPWPGPWAINERPGIMGLDADRGGGFNPITAHNNLVNFMGFDASPTTVVLTIFGANDDGGMSVYDRIDTRMDEPDRGNALKLFSSNASERTEGKLGFLNDAGGLTGISREAAMRMASSLTTDEVSADAMSPAQRTALANTLRNTFTPPQQEIIAAYASNQPDLALALKLRNHFNTMRNRQQTEQMDAGRVMTQLIQQELGMSGNLGTVPPEQINRMRDAALLRYAELINTGEGETPRTTQHASTLVNPLTGGAARATPRVPLTAGQIPQTPPAPTATDTARPQPRPSMPATPASGTARPQSAAPPRSAGDANHARQLARRDAERREALRPPTAQEATERANSLRDARARIVEHVNRPRTYHLNANDRYLDQRVREQPTLRYGGQVRQRTYDPATGRYTISLTEAVRNYNSALFTHGPDQPQTRAMEAVAEYQRVRGSGGSLSTTETNRLNERFRDTKFASARARWLAASPRERQQEPLKSQWAEARAEHETFLRLTAEGLGFSGNATDPAAVQRYLTDALGTQFAREGEQYRDAGRQIITQGRIDVDLGTQLAGGGMLDGTNEALLNTVLANRTKWELSRRSTLDPSRAMREYARAVVDREVDGDDWQRNDEALLGIPENDLDRAALAEKRYQHQRVQGTGMLASGLMLGQTETQFLDNSRRAVDARILAATQAGYDAAKSRGVSLSGVVMPDSPRLPNGDWHPTVLRFAQDADGRLRGTGPPMTSLANQVQQTAGFYRAEIDRQEAILTSAITLAAIVISVALLFIPGVNLVAAGILTALIAGTATIAVKAGMRGGRYGFEEMATDMGRTAIEAASAGIGGKLAAGARLAQVGQRASGVVRVGATLQSRFGPKLAPLANEAITGTLSGASNAAIDDKTWDDGLGMAALRITGRGAQGAASGVVNAGVSGSITRGMQSRMGSAVPRGQKAGALRRTGRALGPNGREAAEEIVSGLAGGLSAESVNVLADAMVYLSKGYTLDEVHKAMGGTKGFAQRFGTVMLRETVSGGGRAVARQHHRRRYQKLAAEQHARGADPDPARAALMARVAKSGGLISEDMTTADFAVRFSRNRARIAEMPAALRPHLEGMDPDSAAQLIAMMDSGQLGTRAERKAFVDELALKVPGLDPAAFDTLLLEANRTHKAARRTRKRAVAATVRAVRGDLHPAEQAALARVDLTDLVGLPPAALAKLAAAVKAADGQEAVLRALAHEVAPDDAVLARRIGNTLVDAVTQTAEARRAVRIAQARTRDDVMLAAPDALKDTIAAMPPEDLAVLQRLVEAGDASSLAQAVTLLGRAGRSRAETEALVRQMSDSTAMDAKRYAHLDNVPPEHRATMAQLPDDMIMELRVAQATRKTLPADRIDAMLAEVKALRPGADLVTLRLAIKATLSLRHGRPGFREAITQKRALLDLVPWGMKRMVLRTPILTVPEGAFLSYVRGKGNENAVTLIVNGEPVVLLRAGANVRALAEEGVHVLQYHDPDWRERISFLDERNLARWGTLSVEAQVEAVRLKMAAEVNAHERMIAKLDRRAALARSPATRRQARLDIEAAEMALANLRSRLARADAVTPDAMLAMAADPSLRPAWLDQPARLFSKGDQVSNGDQGQNASPRYSEDDTARMLEQIDRITARVSRYSREEVMRAVAALRESTAPRDLLRALRGVEVLDGFEGIGERIAARLAGRSAAATELGTAATEHLASSNIRVSLLIRTLTADFDDAASPFHTASRSLLERLADTNQPVDRSLVHAIMSLRGVGLRDDILPVDAPAQLRAAALRALTDRDASAAEAGASIDNYTTELRRLFSGGFARMLLADTLPAVDYLADRFVHGAGADEITNFASAMRQAAAVHSDHSHLDGFAPRAIIALLRQPEIEPQAATLLRALAESFDRTIYADPIAAGPLSQGFVSDLILFMTGQPQVGRVPISGDPAVARSNLAAALAQFGDARALYRELAMHFTGGADITPAAAAASADVAPPPSRPEERLNAVLQHILGPLMAAGDHATQLATHRRAVEVLRSMADVLNLTGPALSARIFNDMTEFIIQRGHEDRAKILRTLGIDDNIDDNDLTFEALRQALEGNDNIALRNVAQSDEVADLAGDTSLTPAQRATRLMDILRRDPDQAFALSGLGGSRPGIHAERDAMRGRIRAGGFDIEAMLLDAVVSENAAAIARLRTRLNQLRAEDDILVFGIQRGGALLAEALSELAPNADGTPNLPEDFRVVPKGPSSEREFHLPAMIQQGLAEGRRTFVIADFYMGGGASSAFVNFFRNVRRLSEGAAVEDLHLPGNPDEAYVQALRELRQWFDQNDPGPIRFETLWLRDRFGYERNDPAYREPAPDEAGFTPPLNSEEQALRRGIVPAREVPPDMADVMRQTVMPVRFVLGDDMDTVVDGIATRPVRVFGNDGEIVQTITPPVQHPAYPGVTLRTTRQIMVALMQGFEFTQNQ